MSANAWIAAIGTANSRESSSIIEINFSRATKVLINEGEKMKYYFVALKVIKTPAKINQGNIYLKIYSDVGDELFLSIDNDAANVYSSLSGFGSEY